LGFLSTALQFFLGKPLALLSYGQMALRLFSEPDQGGVELVLPLMSAASEGA
jgi:hypothetical protein